MILALGIVFIPSFARITRSEFLARKDMDYVKSARLMGVSHLRIIFVHILPNTVPSLLSMAAIGFNNAVLSEAGMSFLGIGVQPPDASLGRMLSESQTYLMTAPWGSVFPVLPSFYWRLAYRSSATDYRRKAVTDMALLDVRDLKIAFYDTTPPTEVVKGISFSLEEGETLGIVGESGSGKTQTALSILHLFKGKFRPYPAEKFSTKILPLRTLPARICSASAERNQHDFSGTDDLFKSGSDHRRTDCRGTADP